MSATNRKKRARSKSRGDGKLLDDRDRAARVFGPKDRAAAKEGIREVRRDSFFADYDLQSGFASQVFLKDRVYLRFGDLPGNPGGRSGELAGRRLLGGEAFERGLSVFSGSLTEEGHYLAEITNDRLHSSLITCCSLDDRDAYLVRGEPLKGIKSSRGESGEPLLKRVHSIEPLARGCVVGATRPSFALEDWNRRRGALPGEPQIPGAAERTAALEASADGLPLLAEVLGRSSEASKRSPIHGPDHWRRVAVNAAHLRDETAGTDGMVVLLFALFHDTMRRSDATDPAHGRRSAALVAEVLAKRISGERLEKLREACALHADGLTSDDPTVGACWDADRLDLWRVGAEPNPALLSTVAAKEPETIARARELQDEDLEWEEVFGLFGNLEVS